LTPASQFVLDIDKKTLESAPGFDKDNWPDMAEPDFATSVHKFYNRTPYWEQEFTDSGDYMGDNRQTNRSIEFEPTNRPAARH